jgi:anoctamin-5
MGGCRYNSKIIGYGLVTMFAAALPIAPLLFLLTNWIDVKLDVSRLLINGRRPLAVRAEDIGEWQRIMGLLNTLAVLNNACLMAFSARFGCKLDEQLGVGARLWFIIIFEHVVFGLKNMVAAVVPDVPSGTAQKLQAVRQKIDAHFANEISTDLDIKDYTDDTEV